MVRVASGSENIPRPTRLEKLSIPIPICRTKIGKFIQEANQSLKIRNRSQKLSSRDFINISQSNFLISVTMVCES